jgi:hypothetical protein
MHLPLVDSARRLSAYILIPKALVFEEGKRRFLIGADLDMSVFEVFARSSKTERPYSLISFDFLFNEAFDCNGSSTGLETDATLPYEISSD